MDRRAGGVQIDSCALSSPNQLVAEVMNSPERLSTRLGAPIEPMERPVELISISLPNCFQAVNKLDSAQPNSGSTITATIITSRGARGRSWGPAGVWARARREVAQRVAARQE